MKTKSKSLQDHNNVSVRLMFEYLEKALKAAKAGKSQDACTMVRLAARFEKNIPSELRVDSRGVII
jgi:hypothetical protein